MKIKFVLILTFLCVFGISSALMAQNGSDLSIDYQIEFNDLEYFNQESSKSERKNIAKIVQNGNNNNAVQRMSKGAANQQYIHQNGEWNNSEQRASEENNFSSIKQNGNNNNALTIQNGSYNNTVISQVGDSNSAEIKQFSDNNTALIKQSGNNNNAVVIQY